MNARDAKEYRFAAWALAVISLIGAIVVAGGRQPFLPDGMLLIGLFAAYCCLAAVFCGYVLFFYRQSDPTYPYGWKRVRSKGRLSGVYAVAAIFPMAGVASWLFLMATEVTLGAVAGSLDGPDIRVAAKCVSSYRNKLRGPGNQITLASGKTVWLYGFPRLCGNQMMGDVVLVARSSILGLWVNRVEDAR